MANIYTLSKHNLCEAQRLFVCDWALNRGVSPLQLLKFSGLRKDDEDATDFNAEHPRWLAGSPGGIGGEFVYFSSASF